MDGWIAALLYAPYHWTGSIISTSGYCMHGKARCCTKLSSLYTSSCGVPKVLYSFIMYTTPLSSLISSLSLNHHLYGDDTQLFFFFHPPDLDSSITYLQDSLQQISSWMTTNLLTQLPKTEFLLIGL